MKSLLFVGGPLILFTCFSLWSDLLTFGEQHPGAVHVGGAVPEGALFGVHKEVYQCGESGKNCTLVDESIEFSEVDSLELEDQAIEYRDGLGTEYNKTKQPGIPKYANITMKRPSGFDWKNLKFVFEREAALDEVRKVYDEKLQSVKEE